MDIFTKNIKAIFDTDIELANKLQSIASNETYEVFVTDLENLSDLKIVDNRDGTLVDNSLESIEKKLQEFELFDNYYALYFFGIGSGTFYKRILKNINHKKVYIFEPELELIYIVLNLIDFSKEISEKRLIINLTRDVNLFKAKQIIDTQSKFYIKVYNLDIYSSYYDKYLSQAKKINDTILLILKHFIQDKGDSLDDTLTGYKHSSEKMLDMFRHPSLQKVLKSLKKRKYAVLVSTGPSLEKQLPILKKYQEYFTILSVDASFPVLYNAGIKPDIVLGMERIKEVANFFTDIPADFFKDIVFMLATVCHSDAFAAIKGGITCPYLRADTHNMALGLDEWGYLGGGLCGANYLFTLAINAEFKDFVFIGQDLAFSKDGRSHAQGHVFGTDGEKFDEKFDGYIPAYGGDGEVATQKYWRLFLNDFVVQIGHSKSRKPMEIYNATEGGARIPDTIEIPFQEYCENILITSESKDKLDISYPSEEEISKNELKYISKQKENLKLAKSVKKQAKKTFDFVEQFLKEIQNLNNTELIKNVKNRELDELLDKIYFVKDKYTNPKFVNTYTTLFMSYLEHVDFEIALAKTMRENTPEAIKLKKINYIKVHYEWLYRLWASLEKIIEITEQSVVKKGR